MRIKLYKKYTCRRPTLLGFSLIVLVLLISGRLFMPCIYNFLYVNDAIKTKTMILEGWVPTYALPKFIEEFDNDNYDNLIVTGIPITQFEYASDFTFTSQATVQALKHFGFTKPIYEADIPTNIYKDRTYSTAIVAKEIFENHPDWQKSFNIYSMGVHSRRSRWLFEKAFTKEYEIGIIAKPDRSFIGSEWWTSSIGFRNISNEALAYFYNIFFFHPDAVLFSSTINKGKLIDKHSNERFKKNIEFTDTVTSPFTKEEIEKHKGFKYFDVNENLVISSKFTIDTTTPTFEMNTTTARKPIYRIYGYLDFVIHDTSYRLIAYQNMGHINDPEYGRYLFLPFTDKTNGITTYGGGRYLDIEIPNSDNVTIDFNYAYNPYCAYSKRWSCPLVPFENHLNTKIKAGEKKYK